MIHLSAVQTLQFDTDLEYHKAIPKIERIAEQTGASVEWNPNALTAVLTAHQELEQL